MKAKRKAKCFTLGAYTVELLEQKFPHLPCYVSQTQIVERAVQELWERLSPSGKTV